MAIRMRFFTFGFLGLLAIAHAAAQNPPVYPLPDAVRIPWNAPNPEPFGKSLAAECTGDRVDDVVVARGRSAYLVHAPRLYGGASLIASDVDDFDRWPAPEPGAADSVVLASTSRGIRRAAWVPAQIGSPGYVVVEDVAGLEQHPARFVRCQDLDGVSGEELVLVAPDGLAIEIWQPSDQVYERIARFDAAGSVHSLHVLQWDEAADGLELAVVSSAGLHVYSPLAPEPPLFSDLRAVSEPASTVLRSASEDRLAWLIVGTIAGERLLVVSGRTGSQPPMSLGWQLKPVGLAALTLDLDDQPELLISQRFNHYLPILFQRTSTSVPPGEGPYTSYDPWTALVPVLITANEQSFAENRAHPAVADFDRDGDFDAWFPILSTEEGIFCPGVAIDGCSTSLKITAASRYVQAPEMQPPTQVEFELELGLPDGYALPTDANALEFLVWRRALSQTSYTFLTRGTQALASPTHPGTLTIYANESVDELGQFEALYVLQIRLVGPGGVAGPFSMFTISGSAFGYQDALLEGVGCTAQGFGFSPWGPQAFGIENVWSPREAENIGGIVPRPRPPGENTPPSSP